MAVDLERFRPGMIWPGGARAAACFTFDVDGEAWLLGVDGRNADLPVTMSQAAYGPRVGVFEILRVLRWHEVAATFFVPSWIAERYPATVEAIVEEGHEVGLHGHVHEYPQALEPDRERELTAHSLEALTRIAGTRPAGYRAPGAEVSPSTIAILAELGVRYSSQFMDDYLPYFHATAAGEVVELPFHWALDDWPFTMLSPYALPIPHVNTIVTNHHIIDVWTAEFDARRNLGGLFVLCNHPQVTGRPGRLTTLDVLLTRAREAGDVWITTGGQVSTHWRAHRPEVRDRSAPSDQLG